MGRQAPPPPPGPASQGGSSQPSARRESLRSASLAERLRASGRHPVILFGTSTSGKSTLLVSLFHCLNHNSDIGLQLGAPILDPASSDGKVMHEKAIELFERRVAAFDEGEVLESTQLEQPFFVPVDVQPRDASQPVRFAFLEARGEWFDPSQEERGSIYRGLKEEIVEILEHFSESISMLYVAPYSVAEVNIVGTRASDTGLTGAIHAYRTHREAIAQDFHLFLLTKWDQHAVPLADSPEFSRVRAKEVDRIITERYPKAWRAYQAMPLGGRIVRRFFMQYTAGHIRGGMVREPPERHRRTFDRYNHTIWNWLYGNATQEADGDGYTFTRGELFRDVAPRDATRMTFVERITSLILSR